MTTFGAQWDQNQNKPLYRFNNKQTKIKLWQYKVCHASTQELRFVGTPCSRDNRFCEEKKKTGASSDKNQVHAFPFTLILRLVISGL
ncbi:hypothetical protein HanHA300_Chr15g0574721 [Helianthus annuus]|nr:hypothetical protein HanHA300_Chr15g0574721 [Helianthus annuus]KAJ0473972.1 hypothetical protein HanHA89_Chr15g0624441 [Helianthus annuus]KAJ0649545.1 hypothetical protein HanLR1_Chr15g0585521 [Helianthus annuus]